MKSLKDETDGLYAIINRFEEATKESNRIADQADCDIRDFGKKVHGLEIEFDETTDKLNKAGEAFEEKDKNHREVEADSKGNHILTDQNTAGCHGWWSVPDTLDMMRRMVKLWRPP